MHSLMVTQVVDNCCLRIKKSRFAIVFNQSQEETDAEMPIANTNKLRVTSNVAFLYNHISLWMHHYSNRTVQMDA